MPWKQQLQWRLQFISRIITGVYSTATVPPPPLILTMGANGAPLARGAKEPRGACFIITFGVEANLALPIVVVVLVRFASELRE